MGKAWEFLIGVFANPIYAAVITSAIGFLLNIVVLVITPRYNRSSSARYKASIVRRLEQFTFELDILRRRATGPIMIRSLMWVTLFMVMLIGLLTVSGSSKSVASTLLASAAQAACAFALFSEMRTLLKRARLYTYPLGSLLHFVEEIDRGNKVHLLTVPERESVLKHLSAWVEEFSPSHENKRDRAAISAIKARFKDAGSIIESHSRSGT